MTTSGCDARTCGEKVEESRAVVWTWKADQHPEKSRGFLDIQICLALFSTTAHKSWSTATWCRLKIIIVIILAQSCTTSSLMVPDSGWEGRALPVVKAPWRCCHHRCWPEPSVILCCHRSMASGTCLIIAPALSYGTRVHGGLRGAASRLWQWNTTTLPSQKDLRSH